MKPRLSIGLPVYNGEPYFSQSMEALLSQDWGDFELLISDNASTDGTPDAAASFARRDRRVRFMRQPVNLGAAPNFNVVFHMASAPLFKWACADDTLAAGFLGRAVAELDAHPEAVICYGQISLIDGEGNSLGAYSQNLDLRDPDEAARFRTARDFRGLMNVFQGITRTAALSRTRLMQPFPGTDEHLMVAVSMHGTFRELQIPMLLRRMHGSAASANRTIEGRQLHLDPSAKGRRHMDNWRRSSEHLRAVLHAPLSLRRRLRLLGVVLKGMATQPNRTALRWELTGAGRDMISRLLHRRPPAAQH
jgi:hypothetical protein